MNDRISDWQDHKDHFEWYRDTFSPVYVFTIQQYQLSGYVLPGGRVGFELDKSNGLRLIYRKPSLRRWGPALGNEAPGEWHRTETALDHIPLPLAKRLKYWDRRRPEIADLASIPSTDIRQLVSFAAMLNPPKLPGGLI